MKTVKIWMVYKSYSSIEKQVPDDWKFDSLDELTDDILKELDEGIIEAVPEDWGFKEV